VCQNTATVIGYGIANLLSKIVIMYGSREILDALKDVSISSLKFLQSLYLPQFTMSKSVRTCQSSSGSSIRLHNEELIVFRPDCI
jgi:hypothetical protein